VSVDTERATVTVGTGADLLAHEVRRWLHVGARRARGPGARADERARRAARCGARR
jgi:hypothetical protein